MDNAIETKSFAFSVRIVRLVRYLTEKKHETVLSRQVLRAGTSIGANVAEAVQAQSHADFVSKMSIALKEASETDYWLRLLAETDYITKEQADSMLADCRETVGLLTAILKTARNE